MTAPTAEAAVDRAAIGYASLRQDVETLFDRLLSHPIYSSLEDVADLRIFMSNHVFAVWDFMTLLKTLQRTLTCVDCPWTPPRDTLAARLINEIVLTEETDEVAPGKYMGHFHLYLAAMGEVSADTRDIRDLIAALRAGTPVADVLCQLKIPEFTRQFVTTTMKIAQLPVHQVAAAFLLGRETLLPSVFERVLERLKSNLGPCKTFRLYLERHAVLDQEEHGPKGEKLLAGLCGSDAARWREATNAAQVALNARLLFWDGLFHLIQTRAMSSEAFLAAYP